MDLHGRVINIKCEIPTDLGQDDGLVRSYRIGHRDARHAAAALASEHAAVLKEYEEEVQRCFAIARRLDELEPGIAGAFTGWPSERIARHLAVMRDDFA